MMLHFGFGDDAAFGYYKIMFPIPFYTAELYKQSSNDDDDDHSIIAFLYRKIKGENDNEYKMTLLIMMMRMMVW